MNLIKQVKYRVSQLPDKIWDCERCGEEEGMEIRRSSLNDQFMADDIALKCQECYYFASHGVPFDDPHQFERELEERDSRILDFALGGPKSSAEENLEALGYIAKAEDV